LTRYIYMLTKKVSFLKDFGLAGQIQRASVSIMANIAEGFDRRSKKDFVKFLNMASSSASEVQSHLYVALDQDYISEEEFKRAYDQTQRVKNLINGLIIYLIEKGNSATATLRRIPAAPQHCNTATLLRELKSERTANQELFRR